MKWLCETCSHLSPGGWFNKKMSCYLYRKSHYGDKMILRPSYLHNGISYTGKTTSLYWIRAHWAHLSMGKFTVHWGQVTHICVCKLINIDSNNSLSPGWCQAIIWTYAGILLIQALGTNFSEILNKIHIFSFKKMHLKISSATILSRPQCVRLFQFYSRHCGCIGMLCCTFV